MAKQQEPHIFSGMQKDISVSKHPAQFIYDGMNIRLTSRDGNTLLSVTNERGTLETNMHADGSYLGHCLLNQYLVIFSTVALTYHITDKDYITRIDLSKTDPEEAVVELYKGDLGFSLNYPIEAIASYETETIQKVYWTDGHNQPRMINIAPSQDSRLSYYNSLTFDFISELQLNEKVMVEKMLGASGSFAPGVIQYAFTYYRKYGQETNIFYTSPLLYISHLDRGASPEDKVENAFRITVNNVDNNFDYLRIYSIHRTSLDAVPVCRRVQDILLENAVNNESIEAEYVSSGVMPTAIVEGQQKSMSTVATEHSSQSVMGYSAVPCLGIRKSSCPDLVLKTADKNVTWGENAPNNHILWVTASPLTVEGVPSYYIFETVEGNNQTHYNLRYVDRSVINVSFTDTGTVGDSIDPTELLYKGGETILAGTLEQKDNTLFLGNISIARAPLSTGLKRELKSESGVTISPSTRSFNATEVSSGNYPYASQLTSYTGTGDSRRSVPCGGFKRGDYYRCGVQFQYKTGKWSDPVFIGDRLETQSPSIVGNTVTVPTFKGRIPDDIARKLGVLDYVKARAVVVFPEMQDRVTVCQGVVNPTMYTDEHRTYREGDGQDEKGNDDLYAQSSWFFRPHVKEDQVSGNGTVAPARFGTLTYQTRDTSDSPDDIRKVEIQGDFKIHNRFIIDNSLLTLHSPDIEFDSHLQVLDFSEMQYRKAGVADFQWTFSDIDIQTESPTISDRGGGFIHKSFSYTCSFGIGAGLFYDDFLVDDLRQDSESGVYKAGGLRDWEHVYNPVKFMVYPWHRNGSLNNDINRPVNQGVRSAMLKKKVISNLRIANTGYTDLGTLQDFVNIGTSKCIPQLFSSNEPTVVKIGGKVYMGNIDTLLNPDNTDGVYFAFNTEPNEITTKTEVHTPFTADVKWKTFNGSDSATYRNGVWYNYSNGWESLHDLPESEDIGDVYRDLVVSKSPVRMKYKSTPHLVINTDNLCEEDVDTERSLFSLPIVEVVRPGDDPQDQDNPTYRKSMFGGDSSDALMANKWIPCGEPVRLDDVKDGYVEFSYDYGDTYYQRYDCLKTYAFTPEDVNQIVEIGSFMLETHVNIDGRYDRNRGQTSNLNMSPQNFNLINPVYSQMDNFFTYRMMDDDYYDISSFPNQITWTREKHSGADVDVWTNITLASTYDMDGAKGKVVSLNNWKNEIYCFQQKGVSAILFNSRVQIPTSDGNPIEITNNYKVDGFRFISDGVGCTSPRHIKETPAGIYFIDSVSNHLFLMGEGMSDISQASNMTSWFMSHRESIIRLTYDDVHRDLYAICRDTALCYSEVLGQFTSQMSYEDTSLIESYGQRVFTMKSHPSGNYEELWAMFEGKYGSFFRQDRPWSLTFISNGIANSLTAADKTFTNLEFRACVEGDGEYDESTGKFTPTLPFDTLCTWNEYQHGIAHLRHRNGYYAMMHHTPNKEATLKRKFRIWRCDIPRDNATVDPEKEAPLGISRFRPHPLDRMRNPWLYIRLQKEASESMKRTEVHDIVMTYFV